MYDEIKLAKRLEQEQYILDGMRPTSKLYQRQYQLVKQLKDEVKNLNSKVKPTKGNLSNKDSV
jgi:hypothetical protein